MIDINCLHLILFADELMSNMLSFQPLKFICNRGGENGLQLFKAKGSNASFERKIATQKSYWLSSVRRILLPFANLLD